MRINGRGSTIDSNPGSGSGESVVEHPLVSWRERVRRAAERPLMAKRPGHRSTSNARVSQ